MTYLHAIAFVGRLARLRAGQHVEVAGRTDWRWDQRGEWLKRYSREYQQIEAEDYPINETP